MDKPKHAYRCGKCDKPKRESEMYKIMPPSLCEDCFAKVEKITRDVLGWGKDEDGNSCWMIVRREIVPKNQDHRKDAFTVYREI
jgi:NAD-dependent SIR2 family protein deacetylase